MSAKICIKRVDMVDNKEFSSFLTISNTWLHGYHTLINLNHHVVLFLKISKQITAVDCELLNISSFQLKLPLVIS